MFRHLFIIIGLSIAVALWLPGVAKIFESIMLFFNYVINLLSVKFGPYEMGKALQMMVALSLIPLVLGGFTRFAFWLMKRQSSIAVPMVMWGSWLILLTILAVKP